MPVANPDGMANNLRTNIRGVDLNRNFEARNRKNIKRYGEKPLSEPESRALKNLILEYEPTRILTIHQPFGCIDYDGNAAGIAERMGQFCELPVEKVGAMPGSLGSFAGIETGIPIITLELKENDHLFDDRTLWDKYGKALLAFVTYPEDF
jgi:protein MpaA